MRRRSTCARQDSNLRPAVDWRKPRLSGEQHSEHGVGDHRNDCHYRCFANGPRTGQPATERSSYGRESGELNDAENVVPPSHPRSATGVRVVQIVDHVVPEQQQCGDMTDDAGDESAGADGPSARSGVRAVIVDVIMRTGSNWAASRCHGTMSRP